MMASPKEATLPLGATGMPMTPGGGIAMLQDDPRADEQAIPIRITLGDATLSMGDAGRWELEHSTLQEYVEQVEKLKQRNEKLDKENAQLKERCSRLTEESNMEKFKCQLLVEMLALSSLDEERSRGDVEKERARVASMKNDLQTLMEQARKQGVDVRTLTSVISAP